jgi:cytoskeletal protein CcmA (bactofilin family)
VELWEKPAESAELFKEHATIGASIVIKGEISGNEPLFIDGTVEGSVNVAGHRVTAGRASHIHADIHAQDVVVMGHVKGNIYCADLLDVRADSMLEGHLVAKRIRIDDGASLKGSVEVHPAKGAEAKQATAVSVSPAEPESALAKAVESRATREAAAAASPGQGSRRVSNTLIEPAG